MPSGCDIQEKDAHLTILDLPGGPTVLYLDARRLLAPLGDYVSSKVKPLYQDPNHSVAEICSMLGISRSTFFRYINVRNTINGILRNLADSNGGILICDLQTTLAILAYIYFTSPSA